MTLTVSELISAAGGGALGAAFGALLAFSLMGAICVVTASLAVAATPALVTGVALGPALGPHVTFAGGVAAAAYAAHIKGHGSGRDIAAPLIAASQTSILLVGALFGVLGEMIATLVSTLSVRSGSGTALAITDAWAASVVATALLAKLLWGRGRADGQPWLPWQRSLSKVATVGALFGLVAGAIYLAWPAEHRGVVGAFVYGLSALSLIALVFGKPVPVTHHITLPAALAADLVAIHGGGDIAMLFAAAACGALAAFIAEFWARVVLERSSVHIDPPAFAIAVAATAFTVMRVLLA